MLFRRLLPAGSGCRPLLFRLLQVARGGIQLHIQQTCPLNLLLQGMILLFRLSLLFHPRLIVPTSHLQELCRLFQTAGDLLLLPLAEGQELFGCAKSIL